MKKRSKKIRVEVKDSWILYSYVIIVLIAAFLRLYYLDLRPVHFDEGGGHALGAMDLLEHGRYTYNPDFHGPFLYHVTALSFFLFGMSDVTLRLTEALFGIALILILYPIRSYFDKFGFLVMALLIAISPSLVYYSRFAVHDSFFIFFTLAVVVCMFLYEKYRKNIYAYLFTVNLAFLFTVKENAYIFFAIVCFYMGFEFLYSILTRKGGLIRSMNKSAKGLISWVKENKRMILISVLLFVFVFSILYSSFFRYPKNIKIALTEPVLHWLKKSTEKSGFVAPYTFYLNILKYYEFAVFSFGFLGIFYFLKENNRFTRFIAIWTFITIIIYLFMPYKEPNNVINIVLPLGISSGLFISGLFKWFDKNRYTPILLVIFLVVAGFSLRKSWIVNFVDYSKDENLLTYVQTVDDVKPMLKEIAEIQKRGENNVDMAVSINQGEYPLSWYFRDYKNVRFYSDKVELPDSWTGIKWSGDGQIIWATDEAKNGERSGKIFGGNGTDGEWRQKIAVVGGYDYKLSGWVKTENIENVDSGKLAKMYVRTLDARGDPDKIISETESVTGTKDWTYVETTFHVEPDVSHVWLTMNIGNWGKAKGTIWYDDISLTREGDDRNLIINPGFENGQKIDKFLGTSIIVVSENDGQTLQQIDGYDMKKYTLRPGVVLAMYIKV